MSFFCSMLESLVMLFGRCMVLQCYHCILLKWVTSRHAQEAQIHFCNSCVDDIGFLDLLLTKYFKLGSRKNGKLISTQVWGQEVRNQGVSCCCWVWEKMCLISCFLAFCGCWKSPRSSPYPWFINPVSSINSTVGVWCVSVCLCACVSVNVFHSTSNTGLKPIFISCNQSLITLSKTIHSNQFVVAETKYEFFRKAIHLQKQ